MGEFGEGRKVGSDGIGSAEVVACGCTGVEELREAAAKPGLEAEGSKGGGRRSEASGSDRCRAAGGSNLLACRPWAAQPGGCAHWRGATHRLNGRHL